MLLKITLLIFKLSFDLSIGGGSSAPPGAVFIILQIINNKANLQANHHPTRHHTENCINSLAPSVGTTNRFLRKKKNQNGDIRSDHVSHQQKWIHTDLGLHAENLNSNTAAFIAQLDRPPTY
jgi:hypothetical protein